MTYELAKQLKDAGFPSKPKAWREFVANETMDQGLEVPTLSELIEACGEDFSGIEKADVYRTGGFGADAPREFVGTAWFAKGISVMCQADTAEEAVAKLWLALHKK